MASSTRITSILSNKWVGQTDSQLDSAVLEMATDIHKRAVILAPVESGNLRNSGKVERVKNAQYRISFGGGIVKYAKRRHYENKKNPQTLGYLAKAGESVGRSKLDKYVKGTQV